MSRQNRSTARRAHSAARAAPPPGLPMADPAWEYGSTRRSVGLTWCPRRFFKPEPQNTAQAVNGLHPVLGVCPSLANLDTVAAVEGRHSAEHAFVGTIIADSDRNPVRPAPHQPA